MVDWLFIGIVGVFALIILAKFEPVIRKALKQRKEPKESIEHLKEEIEREKLKKTLKKIKGE